MGLWIRDEAARRRDPLMRERFPASRQMSPIERTTLSLAMAMLVLARMGDTHPEFVASPWVSPAAWGAAFAPGLMLAWIAGRDRDPRSVLANASRVDRWFWRLVCAVAFTGLSWWLLVRTVPQFVIAATGATRVESGQVVDLADVPGRKGCKAFATFTSPSFDRPVTQCVSADLLHRLVRGQAIGVEVQVGAPGRQAAPLRDDAARAGAASGGSPP